MEFYKVKSKNQREEKPSKKWLLITLLIVFFLVLFVAADYFLILNKHKSNNQTSDNINPGNPNVSELTTPTANTIEPNSSNDNFDYKGQTSTTTTAPTDTNANSNDPLYYYNLGNSKLANKEYQPAIDYYNKALALNDKEPNYYNKKAEAQIGLNQKNEAVQTLETGLINCPGNQILQDKLDIIKNVIK